nr:uncharacterized protein CI109_006131 [Kwoniella shandongensis]KAA5525558.1 hypothetical protein CI109_006131 [Kwoniella shandongensis]
MHSPPSRKTNGDPDWEVQYLHSRPSTQQVNGQSSLSTPLRDRRGVKEMDDRVNRSMSLLTIEREESPAQSCNGRKRARLQDNRDEEGDIVILVGSDSEDEPEWTTGKKHKGEGNVIDLTGSAANGPQRSAHSSSRQPTSSSSSGSTLTTSGKHDNKRVVWLPSDEYLPSCIEVNTVLDGKDRKCIKVYRGGMKLNEVLYKLNDAVSFGKDRTKGLIRSIFSIQPLDASVRTRHYIHVHYLNSTKGDNQTELFLEHCQCQDIPLEWVHGKLDFELLGEKSHRGSATSFARYVFEQTHCCFRQPTTPETYGVCDSCIYKEARRRRPVLVNGALHFGSQEYHRFDFIYLDAGVSGRPYLIGQVNGFERLLVEKAEKQVEAFSVSVRLLVRRQDVLTRREGFVSAHHLIVTDQCKEFATDLIMRKCFVFPSEAEMMSSSDNVDSFWCTERVSKVGEEQILHRLQKPLRTCLECLEGETTRTRWTDRKACQEVCKLPAADYYSGAGGFILPGLDFFNWKSAVDNDEVACRTLSQLSRQKTDFKVYFGTVQDWVQRSLEDHSRPSLPLPETIFIMTGGVPCQGHTFANHNRDGLDSRNAELFVFLGEVARLRPYYVVLENVPAFKADVDGETDEEANGNFARRAMKELISIDYQCRLGVLDARSFGSPQNRQRLFIIAAKRGCPLPELPNPTHANPRTSATIFSNVSTGEEYPFFLGRGTPGSGPHAAVTIRDAIGDLPEFRFSPPPGLANGRQARRIPTFNPRVGQHGKYTKVGFIDSVPYKSEPATDYQRAKRGVSSKVKDHCIFVDSRLPSPSGPKRAAEWDKGFSTLLTSSRPGGKATNPIHPDGERTFSIAERKRAMGFPDWYRLSGSPVDQDRLTGNAVCYETVEAIYRTVFETCVVPWWIAAGRPTEDLMAAFRRDHP